jgi:hypothetical protein
MRPKATRNGATGAIPDASCCRTVRYDCAAGTAPRGKAAVTAVTSARTAAAESALRNRYSSCALAGTFAGLSRAISSGTTQPSAEPVTEVAMPTTVSVGVPATPVAMSSVPSPVPGGRLPFGYTSALDRTTWPGRCAQCPDCRTTSSTGPPGDARPTRVMAGLVCAP